MGVRLFAAQNLTRQPDFPLGHGRGFAQLHHMGMKRAKNPDISLRLSLRSQLLRLLFVGLCLLRDSWHQKSC
eukprot:5119368-Amphidinium_carterae.1